MPSPATPAQFISKWTRTQLPERAASQEHFLDLCHLLGQPTPAEHDPTGTEYCFEKGVSVTGAASAGSRGDRGFADVWWRGKFGWEYKRRDKHRDLVEAYRQLCQYREALENPPLLVVSDIARIEIHTNFTGTQKVIHPIALADMADPDNLDKLRRLFTDPHSFRPNLTTEKVTKRIADEFAALAERLRGRGHDPHLTAHFLMRCMFCLFAEDVDLLPTNLFERLLETRRNDLASLQRAMTELFAKMRTGGQFGVDDISWFNGGLFDNAATLPLEPGDLATLQKAARSDWSCIEPAIFGTLFERLLDPDQRAQIGAHYTGRDDIMLIVEPVVMAPLRREWQRVRDEAIAQLRSFDAANAAGKRRIKSDIERSLTTLVDRLASLRILDPACGSGNFLYVAIQQLLELEKEVITFAAQPDLNLRWTPRVRPTQLLGIEINPYAAELAQVVIWIGYLQWMRDNGFHAPREPILDPLQSIENRDAILDRSDPALTVPAQWPDADFIIGNPPFLGVRQFRQSGIEDEYVNNLFAAYEIPNTSDLCCYWFATALRATNRNSGVRVGLLATQGIRGRDSRAVLDQIDAEAQIFMAWSDREWILDGAAVRISMVAFTRGRVDETVLDGAIVPHINADLRAGLDFTRFVRLAENTGIAFQGPVKVGAFDIELAAARRLLSAPNPRPISNTNVVVRWIRGEELNKRIEPTFIIDFAEMALELAAQFEAPFEYVRANVRAFRSTSRDSQRREYWWRLGRSGKDLKNAVGTSPRYLVTCQTAKHRVFSWAPAGTLPAQTVIAVTKPEDYYFGALHSSIHELWALRMGTQLEDRPRYTPTTCFETFPLPWPPGQEPTNHPAYRRITEAAKELNALREEWLNPPLWIRSIAEDIDANDDFADVPAEARPLIRQSAIMAAAAKDNRLKKRTLTNLYNERPTWLRLAHQTLDRAVLAAYAAIDPAGEWNEDWSAVWVDTGAGFPLPADHTLAARRAEIDQRVLANLLRLNLARAGRDEPAGGDASADESEDVREATSAEPPRENPARRARPARRESPPRRQAAASTRRRTTSRQAAARRTPAPRRKKKRR